MIERASRALRRLMPTGVRRRPSSALCLALAGVASLLLLASAAPALAAGPAWELKSTHTPSEVPITSPADQVETLTVKGAGGHRANVGKFYLTFEDSRTGKTAETGLLPYTAGAAEVQAKLEHLTIIGTGNVRVTGGPKSGGTEVSWTYTITFVSALGGLELEEAITAEEELPTEKEEEEYGVTAEEGAAESSLTKSGSHDAVEYLLTPQNIGDTATSGKVTVTDRLPAHLTTRWTPEGSGWTCKPAGEGNTEVTCTRTEVVASGKAANPISIEAYVDASAVKPGEVLVNRATVSGGGAASAEGIDSALVSNEHPAVVTAAASAVSLAGATLNATVNPEGKPASCLFEYGSSTAYGSTVPCTSSPGSGAAPVPLSATIGGLSAASTYHFRIVANASAGAEISSYGADQAFTTPAGPPTALTGSASAATQSGGATPIQGPSKPAVPDAELAGRALTASASGIVTVRVSCPAGESSCIGTITLRTVKAVIAGKTKAAILTLASGGFTIAGGQTASVKLHLSAKARKLLARTHLVRALAIVSAHDRAGATHTSQRTVAVRPAKTKSKG